MKSQKQTTDNNAKYFCKLPNALARMDLPIRTKVVAAWLMGYGRTSSSIYPSQERIAEELNLSVRAVRDSIRQLEKAKLFNSQRIGKTCNNRYYPSAKLAYMFDYQGETIESAPVKHTEVTGKNRRRDRQKPPVTATKSAGLEKQNSKVDYGLDRDCSDSDKQDIDDAVLLRTNGQTDKHPTFDEICRSRIGHGYVSSLGDATVDRALIPWDVYGKTADYLVEKYEDRVLRQVNWLPYRSAKKPSGLLIIAIEQNYTQPSDMTPEEIAEVEQLTAERKFYMPPHMTTNVGLPQELGDQFEEVPFGHTPVEPKITHAPSCDDPKCEGCEVW